MVVNSSPIFQVLVTGSRVFISLVLGEDKVTVGYRFALRISEFFFRSP